MIQLTRLNNQALIVNCDLIEFVESAPDTMLTLVSGEKIVVRETPKEVLEGIIRYRRLVLESGGPKLLDPQGNASSAQGPGTGSFRLASEPDPAPDDERGSKRG